MARIAQISDLHFGREIQATVDALGELLNAETFDLIVVSGDLTQRAKPEEFERAKSFLQSLKHPVLVIPGNHDVPLYDLPERFLNPYKRYKYFISDDLCPTFMNDEVCVVGLNTAHGFTFAGGKIPKNIQRKWGDMVEIALQILWQAGERPPKFVRLQRNQIQTPIINRSITCNRDT